MLVHMVTFFSQLATTDKIFLSSSPLISPVFLEDYSSIFNECVKDLPFIKERRNKPFGIAPANLIRSPDYIQSASTAFILEQLSDRLSVPPGRLYLHFNSETELIHQLVSFKLNAISQTSREPPHHLLADELCAFLAERSRHLLLSVKQHCLI